MIPIEFFLMFAAILFIVGIYGIMTRNNAIVVLMCIELVLNAANMNLVTFAAFNGDIMGQVFVMFTVAVAACEVAVGIAIILNVYKVKKTTVIDDLTELRW
ncbi:MAG TPA: NADH-quinone oxidoreductase subunit NuoK [Candidatus Methanomethylophilaceae archaeon]|nr:NADH-quinone oxidoreductase subunit NuoK [Candidatus Methanomethylophilaceae archaeon]